MATQKSIPQRGRPVAITTGDRRRLVFAALDQVFALCGAQGLTMDAVARQAGMSKRTLYSLFENREGMFTAYLEQFAHLLARPVELEFEALPLSERLLLLLEPAQAATSFDLPMAMFRILVQVGQDHPELAQQVLEAGQYRVVALIRGELCRAVRKGEISIHDPESAAQLLCDMIRPAPLSALLEPQKLPDKEALKCRVNLAIRVFLNGISST